MLCRWQSEIEPYCVKVLKKHWPHVPNLGDINKIDWRTVPTVDVICGGYPCQPFSVAGARKGTDDPRHLWPSFADAIRVLRPRYALLENVAGHLTLGFDRVLADLAACGYDAQWDCIPAAAVGAPHRRDRVFIIATQTNMDDTSGKNGRLAELKDMAPGRRRAEFRKPNRQALPQPYWSSNQPAMGGMVDGVPNRLDRLRGLGNAVVPQVAQHVAQTIIEIERINNNG